MNSIFSWNHVSSKCTYLFLLLNCFLYIIIFHLLDNVLPSDLQEKLDKIQHKCFVKCDNELCKEATKLRDNNYFLTDPTGIDLKTCIFTSWELTHLLFHIFIGYTYNIYFSVTTSILFEIIEHYVYDCGSYLDVFWNFIGFLIGFYLRNII